jgi:hypothetical protein
MQSSEVPKNPTKITMKKNILSGLMIFAAASLMAADSNPKDDVKNAATALGNQASYSWHTSVEVPEDAQFKPGPSDGKTEKDGYTTLSLSTFGDNVTEAVLKGTNGAIKTDDGWQSIAEVMTNTGDAGGGGFNPNTFLARMLQNYRMPPTEAADLADAAKDLTETNGAISGDLTEDGAKEMISFRRRGANAGGPPPPEVTNPKGSVKFWLKDGQLVKYQFHVTGSMSFNGNDFDVDRTTTTEIKDVGATKVDVSDDAKKKLQ